MLNFGKLNRKFLCAMPMIQEDKGTRLLERGIAPISVNMGKMDVEKRRPHVGWLYFLSSTNPIFLIR